MGLQPRQQVLQIAAAVCLATGAAAAAAAASSASFELADLSSTGASDSFTLEPQAANEAARTIAETMENRVRFI